MVKRRTSGAANSGKKSILLKLHHSKEVFGKTVRDGIKGVKLIDRRPILREICI